MTSPAFSQVSFRSRNDNGSETTATWRQNQNVNDSIPTGTNFRIRFRIDETAVRAWTSKNWNLYYSYDGGAYTPVTGSSKIQFSLSDNFADGADCTAQLTGGSGTFVTDNNGMKETTGGATNSGSAGYLFELEWCLKIDNAQIAHNKVITLRVYDGSTALGTYTATPSLTINAITSGVLSKTQDNNTISSTGKLAIKGVLSKLQDSNTITATGKLAIKGVLSKTQDANTIVATGTSLTEIHGVLSKTQDNNTVVGTGKLAIKGTLSKQQDNNTVVSAGKLAIKGVLSKQQDNNTISSTGKLKIIGLLSSQQDSNTVAATGKLKIAGTLSKAQDNNTIVSSGKLQIRGTLSKNQDNNLVIATGKLQIKGVLSKSQDNNTIVATGTHEETPNTGVLFEVQDDNTVIATAKLAIKGVSSIIQDNNIILSTAKLYIKGVVNAVQGSDIVLSIGKLSIKGVASIVQDNNTATGTIVYVPPIVPIRIKKYVVARQFSFTMQRNFKLVVPIRQTNFRVLPKLKGDSMEVTRKITSKPVPQGEDEVVVYNYDFVDVVAILGPILGIKHCTLIDETTGLDVSAEKFVGTAAIVETSVDSAMVYQVNDRHIYRLTIAAEFAGTPINKVISGYILIKGEK